MTPLRMWFWIFWKTAKPLMDDSVEYDTHRQAGKNPAKAAPHSFAEGPVIVVDGR